MMYLQYVLFVAFILVFLIAVASKPSSYRLLYFPVLVSIYGCLLLSPQPHGDPVSDYYIGLLASILLAYASNLILLSEPQHSMHRIGQKQPAWQLSAVARLRWAFGLITSLRGVNWNCEVPSLQHSALPRWQFVRSQLAQFGYYYILSDLAAFYTVRNPAFQPGGEHMGDHGFILQIWNVVIFWFSYVTTMSWNYALASVITVAVGWLKPDDWPPLFGRWSEATSVRTFWGKSWHQAIRRMIQPHGKYLSRNILGFKSGSVSSFYTQLFTCFCLSGLFHAAGDWFVLRNPHTALKNVLFFILQAVAITLEDVVIHFLKRSEMKMKFQSLEMALSRIWVIFWLALSSPIWIDTMIQGGMGDHAPPISVIERFWGIYNSNL